MEHDFVADRPSGYWCQNCGQYVGEGRLTEARSWRCPAPEPGWARSYPTLARVVADERISTEIEPVLTRIDEDLWVNPKMVIAVTATAPAPLCETGYTYIFTSDGRMERLPKPLHEVVALLNGSA